MANGNGNGGFDPFGGMPWWAKFIVVIGVPSAIALGLVWSDRTQLSARVEGSHTILVELAQENKAHDARVLARFEELSAATRETNRILLAGCVNDAETAEARERCVGR